MKNIVNLPKNNKDNVTAYYLGKKQRYNPSDRSVSYELQFATERELSEDEMKTLEYFAIDNFAGIFEHSTYVKVFVTEDILYIQIQVTLKLLITMMELIQLI